jgi:hypothetical protein
LRCQRFWPRTSFPARLLLTLYGLAVRVAGYENVGLQLQREPASKGQRAPFAAPPFDEKAVEAVLHWRLKPALGPDNKPVAVRQIIEVTFQLY